MFSEDIPMLSSQHSPMLYHDYDVLSSPASMCSFEQEHQPLIASGKARRGRRLSRILTCFPISARNLCPIKPPSRWKWSKLMCTRWFGKHKNPWARLPNKELVELGIVIMSATLQRENKLTDMKTYAKVWVPPSEQTVTDLDVAGENKPSWNCFVRLEVDKELLEDVRSAVEVEIYSKGKHKDKLVGTCRILVEDFLKGERSYNKRTYFVRRPRDLEITGCLVVGFDQDAIIR